MSSQIPPNPEINQSFIDLEVAWLQDQTISLIDTLQNFEDNSLTSTQLLDIVKGLVDIDNLKDRLSARILDHLKLKTTSADKLNPREERRFRQISNSIVTQSLDFHLLENLKDILEEYVEHHNKPFQEEGGHLAEDMIYLFGETDFNESQDRARKLHAELQSKSFWEYLIETVGNALNHNMGIFITATDIGVIAYHLRDSVKDSDLSYFINNLKIIRSKLKHEESES